MSSSVLRILHYEVKLFLEFLDELLIPNVPWLIVEVVLLVRLLWTIGDRSLLILCVLHVANTDYRVS